MLVKAWIHVACRSQQMAALKLLKPVNSFVAPGLGDCHAAAAEKLGMVVAVAWSEQAHQDAGIAVVPESAMVYLSF